MIRNRFNGEFVFDSVNYRYTVIIHNHKSYFFEQQKRNDIFLITFKAVIIWKLMSLKTARRRQFFLLLYKSVLKQKE